MKADRREIGRLLDSPPPSARLFLLYGPDDSGSAALGQRLAKAMGEGAERTDFSGDQLARDPAALADAAASISMFGDRIWIRVQPAGEEVLPAVEALLESSGAGNAVVIIAGALRKTSKLLTRCLDAPAAICFASYPPDESDAAKIAMNHARERGLRLDDAIARRIVDMTGGERALMLGEVEKLALYHDAEPDHPAEATHDALDALSSEMTDQDAPRIAGLALTGDVEALAVELRRFRATGGSLAGVVRIAMMKAMNLADVLSQSATGGARGSAFKVNGRPLWRDEADEMNRLVHRWTPETIARGLVRLGAAERASRTGGAAGETLIAQELLTIARQAKRGR